MKSRGRWKQIEREIAEILGGVRVPVTGRGRGSAPDVEHPLWAIEVKAGRVVSPRLRLGMRQAAAAAVGTSKTPLLVIVQSLRKGEGESNGKAGAVPSERYVMMRLSDWVLWMGGGNATKTKTD